MGIHHKRVLGMELDGCTVRVVELECGTGTPRVLHTAVVSAPQNLLAADGTVQKQVAFRSAFQETMRQHGILAARVVFALSGARVVYREITLPPVRKSQLDALLQQNLADYLSIRSSEYRLSYTIAEAGKTGYRLLVYAIPYELIASYRSFSEWLGLDLAALDVSGHALLQALPMVVKDMPVRQTMAYLTVASDHALLLFVREGEIRMLRNLPAGLSEPGEESVRSILQAVRHSIEYFYAAFPGESLGLCLLGAAAGNHQLTEALKRELSSVVSVVKTDASEPTAFLTAMGAGICPLFPADPRAKTRKQLRTMLTASAAGLALAVAVVSVLTGIATTRLRRAQTQEQQLRDQLAALQGVVQSEQAYRNASQTWNDVRQSLDEVRQQLGCPNDGLLELLAEWEQQMPASLRVLSLEGEENGLTVCVETDGKADAAEGIRVFRESRLVSLGEIFDLQSAWDIRLKCYDISCLLDEQGHLRSVHLAEPYRNAAQEDLDMLIPALQNGTLAPDVLYTDWVCISGADDAFFAYQQRDLLQTIRPLTYEVECVRFTVRLTYRVLDS